MLTLKNKINNIKYLQLLQISNNSIADKKLAHVTHFENLWQNIL